MQNSSYKQNFQKLKSKEVYLIHDIKVWNGPKETKFINGIDIAQTNLAKKGRLPDFGLESGQLKKKVALESEGTQISSHIMLK